MDYYLPKTYEIKQSNYQTIVKLAKENNSSLLDALDDILKDTTNIWNIILKNGVIIGYVAFQNLNLTIEDYENMFKKNNEYAYHNTSCYYAIAKYYYCKAFNHENESDFLNVSALEIFEPYRSVNTVKVVFNYIKNYSVLEKYSVLFCHPKNNLIKRLYLTAGFKEFIKNPKILDVISTLLKQPKEEIVSNSGKFMGDLLYMDVEQHDYYAVTEKYKKYNLKRDNKALYENIMTSIAKEVKKILNENILHYRTIVNTKKELLSIIQDTIKREGTECDLNWIDVSNITDMSYLFNYPYTNKFNGDISNWNVSNVTDMSYMFYGSDFNGDISNWDVSNVTDMSYMFANSRFNGDISKWNVTKYFANGTYSIDMDDPEAVNISYMFYECPIENEYKPYVYPKPKR